MSGVVEGNARVDEIYKGPCGVEGCSYGDGSNCGLAKLVGQKASTEAYLDNDPLHARCKAGMLTDTLCGIIRDESGQIVGMNLSENVFFRNQRNLARITAAIIE